jgi:hypothetical protein
MKTLLIIPFMFSFLVSTSQNYIQTTTSPVNSDVNLTHKGALILGDQDGTSTDPLQIYSTSANKNMNIILGNASGKWQFAVSGTLNAYFPGATPGTGVIRMLGNQNMIFAMPNDNATDPNSDVTNYNSSGISSIRFGDLVNRQSLVIYNTGKVTMGTVKYDNDSNYRLYVKDGIKSERVKVEIGSDNGWADFVFHENYKLITLKEVENYIKINKHLPEIPTTKEVLENGIELGEMNAKLLQKIEELTLYTINQQKEIENLKNKNVELKSLMEKILELQSKLKRLE